MNDQMMTPLEGMSPSLQPEPTGPANAKPVAGWIAVMSIIFGVLGLLCWGVQSVGGMLTDSTALEEAGIQVSSVNVVVSMASYLFNLVLAVLLTIAGAKAVSGQSGKLLRMWAGLKLLSVALGLVIAFVFFDDIVAMMAAEMDKSFAEANAAAAEQNPDSTVPFDEADEANIRSFAKGLGVALIAVHAVLHTIWPVIVLICVKKAPAA